MKKMIRVVGLVLSAVLLLASCGEPGVEVKLTITTDAQYTVTAGEGITVHLTLERTNLDGSVTISAREVPAGVSVDAISTTTKEADLALMTTAELAPGSYKIELEASAGTVSASATFDLMVEAPVPADAPRVERREFAQVPSVPEGLKISCRINPDERDGTCPVMLWQEHEYWPLDRVDNTGLTLVAFATDGTVVKQWESFKLRYTWQITVDVALETITILGQGTGMDVFSWEELEISN